MEPHNYQPSLSNSEKLFGRQAFDDLGKPVMYPVVWLARKPGRKRNINKSAIGILATKQGNGGKKDMINSAVGLLIKKFNSELNIWQCYITLYLKDYVKISQKVYTIFCMKIWNLETCN